MKKHRLHPIAWRGPIALAQDYARRYGVTPPDAIAGPTLERLKDELWWRRAIRKAHGRTVEATARDLGLVHKGAGIYSSDETLCRRRGQKTRNRKMLEEVFAVNEEGQEFTLAELSDLSVSNPAIRRGELMVRIAGFEAVADGLDHAGEFITMTCPSRYHAYTIKNGRSFRNRKFDPILTPRQGQEYLSKVWSRIRAKLARHDIRLYGFRVAEPNHCGCPHWHMLVFMPKGMREFVLEVFSHYALEDSPNEPGADKHRVTFKAIDKTKGTAAGYIAKYIAKNIDGFALDADSYGGDPIEASERVDAWASCWGIRQFQQLGGPPVSVWRELRRMDWCEEGTIEVVRAAADAGDWAAYVEAMGGPLVSRKALPLRPAYLQEIKTETGELPLNKYGELSPGRMVGIQALWMDTPIITRWHKWEFKRGFADLNKEIQVSSVGDGSRSSFCCEGKGEGDYRNGGNIDGVAGGVAGAGAEFQKDGRMERPGDAGNKVLAFKWETEKGLKLQPWKGPLVCPIPRGLGWNSFQVSREPAYPWSTVNNCTQRAVKCPPQERGCI
ncbi:MAG: replication endonuclease [Candidatus Sedimenticola sp. PURPLELP]